LAQLGVGREHTHASTYFATRILYQRGKLDLSGVIARLAELLRSCPEFPEAAAMLRAAEHGTLRPDARSFNAATVPPPPAPPDQKDDEEDDESDRPTEPGYVAPSSIPNVEAQLKTPQAPGIPRAPLVPRFTPRENVAPSYAPPPHAPEPRLPELDFDFAPPEPPPPSNPWNDTLSAPPPSSAKHPRTLSPPPVAIDLGPLDGVTAPAFGDRVTAPSPGAPGPGATEPPTVFAIATWLAERDFERALAAVEELGAERSPELSLLETRALTGLGRKAAARRSLDRLCRAPLLDPDLRAAVARLLIELGDVDRAEAQARRAHNEDPASDLSRLTLAWAIARSHAWLLSPRSASELNELLSDVVPEGNALPPLGYALRALMLLPSAPDAARKAADAALSLDPSSHDALAAAAVIAQKQGRSNEAQRFCKQLLELDHHAAADLSATLESMAHASLPPPKPAPAPPTPPRSLAKPPQPQPRPAAAAAAAPRSIAQPAPAPPRSVARPIPSPTGASPWEEKEQRLAAGDHRAALFDFEQGLARRLEAIPGRAGPAELSFAAMITARYLTQAPITRHFAPFDLSLFSISRLDAALSLVYRGNTGPISDLRTRVLLGLGAYSGECLRQAYAGEWVGTAADLLRLHIEGQGLCFAPLRDMHARLQAGQELEVGDTPRPHPGAEPLGQRVALDVVPPTPWDPEIWPNLAQIGVVGSHLGRSPVGMFCAAVELPLDLSFASLRAVDRYVTLLAPPLAPPDPEAVWVRRASVLVGAYMGEVLRATRGGNWEPLRSELRAEAYRVALPGGVTALPVAAAFERLSGRRLEHPSDYARRITG
jgi:tetratricopeptide (TPR) repeat protein